jgi:uncharacterized protein YkwD
MSKISEYLLGIVVAAIVFIFVSNLFNIFPLIGDQQAVELRIHDLINQERDKNGLPPLKFDPALAKIARMHSEDMARNNFFEHENLAGEDPSDRATKAGYSCYKNYGSFYSTGVAENIMENHLEIFDLIYLNAFDRLSTSTVNGWMESYGHRRNILTKSYDREGIGIALVHRQIYVTQDFC